MPGVMPFTSNVVETGQLDDGLGEVSLIDPRQGHTFIDDDRLLEWSSEGSDDETSEPGEFEEEEDALEAEAFQSLRAEEEDWEVAEGDFTKQYNRIRQHVAVRNGAAHGVASALNGKTAMATLPAVNRPRPSKPATQTAQEQKTSKDKRENQLQALSKFSSRLRNLDTPYDLGVGVNRKGPSATANMKDKSDRATSEQVLDPRTRIILFKMIGRGLVYEVNGCVSTGKEANVYHALTPERTHLALKIYKTSILVFKDRDRYVSGEFRFRRGYSRHNPRKMVRVWAEKEMRNLKRLQAAGIQCPEPVEVRENILVMTFVGDREGWASPRLKDADIPEAEYMGLYVELMLMTRKIFIECKLVHADLSEYNILYHTDDTEEATEASSNEDTTATEEQQASRPRGHLCIIDVSQSVEHDHPHAFDFLRSDLRNIDDFFSRHGVHTVGLRRSFEFVTRDPLPQVDGKDASNEAILRAWIDAADSPPAEDERLGGEESAAHPAGDDEEVFMRSYIPRTLNEVYDPERDVDVLTRGEGAKLIYKDTIGIVSRNEKTHEGAGTVLEPGRAQSRLGGSLKKGLTFAVGGGEEEGGGGMGGDKDVDNDSGSEGEESESEEENKFTEKKSRGHRHEDKEVKKQRKKAAKEEAREKRKHKIPKADKKRKIKATARGG